MTDSILSSTKKILGIDEANTSFDLDILLHINSVFSTLDQLGVGPAGGFSITGADELWATFLAGDLRLNSVKTYMYLRVRMLFDPPQTSFLLNALQEQIRELEWRLANTADPVTTISTDETVWITNDYEPLPTGIESGDVAIDPNSGDVWRIV